MSDPHRHDLEPDQAALDELMRAFAAEPSVEADQLVIIEQDPLPADPPAAEADHPSPDDPSPDDPTPDDPTPHDRTPHDRTPHDPTPHDPTPHDPTPHDSTPADPAPDEASAPTRGDGRTIVISVDDDLPDAVYVEGSLDADSSRTIVVIEDDASGDTVLASSERDARRGIEPRMRERRVAVKRAQGRKRLKRFGIVAAVVLLLVGALAILGSPLFAIRADQVVVTGNVYADADRLQAVVDDLVGTPVLLVDTQRAERELEAIPWVETARVRTDFPHGASIEIRERQAVTTYQGPDGRFRVLDREGRVLDVIDKYPFAYLLLGGPDPVDLDRGEFAPRGYAAASELAKILTGTVRGRVEIVEVTADGSRLVMRLDDGTEVRFGEARDLLVKLVRLETVLSSSEQREPGVIDVSTSEVTL